MQKQSFLEAEPPRRKLGFLDSRHLKTLGKCIRAWPATCTQTWESLSPAPSTPIPIKWCWRIWNVRATVCHTQKRKNAGYCKSPLLHSPHTPMRLP